MTPTPRTDERANSWESIDGQWVNAEFARWLERELAAKDAHADEIYKAAVNLAAKLEAELDAEREQVAILRSDEKRLVAFAKTYRMNAEILSDKLAAERGLADRLGGELARIAWLQAAIVPNSAELAVAAWKEARRGTV